MELGFPSKSSLTSRSQTQELNSGETIIATKILFWVIYYDNYLNLIMVCCVPSYFSSIKEKKLSLM